MKKNVQFDQNQRRDSNSLDAFKDFESFISIDEGGKINKEMKEFVDGCIKRGVHYLMVALERRSLMRLA